MGLVILYPNPTMGLFNVTVFIDEPVETVTIRVFDMLGKLVASNAVTDVDAGIFEQQVDLQENTTGVYIVAISTPAGTQTQKLVLDK